MWLTVGSRKQSPRKTTVTPRPTKIQGALIPNQYSQLRGRGFSCFEYTEEPPLPSLRLSAPAGSPRNALRHDGSSADRPVFKHSALPPAPNQAGSFQRFRYTTDPYERLEDFKRVELHETKAKTIAGSFAAGGNARDTRKMLNGRAQVRAHTPLRPHCAQKEHRRGARTARRPTAVRVAPV